MIQSIIRYAHGHACLRVGSVCGSSWYQGTRNNSRDPLISQQLDSLRNGHAYVVEGDVYFEVATFPAYGQLSGRKQARRDLFDSDGMWIERSVLLSVRV